MTAEAALPVASATPSADRLAYGLNLAADVIVAICLIGFIGGFRNYPIPALGVTAWALLAGVALYGQLAQGRVIPLLRSWPYLSLALLALADVLDCIGAASPDTNSLAGPAPLAAVASGALLMTYATVRSTQFMVRCIAGLGVLLAADFAVGITAYNAGLAVRVAELGIAIWPGIVGLRVARAFRAMLEFQSDLSQAQAAASVEANAFGLVESEHLTALDQAAEKLLDDVASGSTALPLDAGSAELAGRIASQLRVLLVAGRTRTWLHHALDDSSVVGALTTVDDPYGYAALLAPDQRDGLLTAIWLFAGDATRRAESMTVRVRRADAEATSSPRRLSVVLELAGVKKHRLDPAAWQAINRVGRHRDSAGPFGLTITVDCPVDLVAGR
ncbi:hypothetical protein [Gryllotalpicola sp.]|uniref:hypothetical protein n=1 Tax=Gryllotalpicola sp. TaxID=1932787 RepID=UPI0026199761|nr:hypothetical protein [Gryllotalpicola sp.]